MSKIREMLPGEYGLLDEFLYQAIYTASDEPRPPRAVTEEPALRAYVEGFGRAGDVALCAEEGGRVVGAAWARLMHGYGFVVDGVPEVAVSVLPGHRGCGIGTALLSALIERCGAMGYPALSLSVQRANPAARLYERLGFREVSGSGEEAVMALPLGGRSEGEGVPFSVARAAALRVLTAPALAGRVFLEGGLVPWVASGRGSGRLHGDVDISVRLLGWRARAPSCGAPPALLVLRHRGCGQMHYTVALPPPSDLLRKTPCLTTSCPPWPR